MSANNASLYESAREEIEKPIDYSGLGLKAKKITEGAGPIQPPIGQATLGAAKDIAETVGADVGDLAVGAAGLYGLKKLWDKYQESQKLPPAAPPITAPTTPPAQAPVSPVSNQGPAASKAIVPPTAEQINAAMPNVEQQAAQAGFTKGQGVGQVSKADIPVLTNLENVKLAEEVKKGIAPEATALTKEQKGMKNYLVSQYGGGPEGEAAYKKIIEILGETPAYEKGQGGGLSKEANQLIKDWRKSNIEGPKVNLTHDMKKVMKGAGGLAILTALPGFAEAAQQKDVGKMGDIFTDFFVLPFAQSRGLNEGEEQELAKRRYEGAVGGGRGIAPPSAYQR